MTDFPEYLDTIQASAYLKERFGISRTHKSLCNLRVTGGGPPYRRVSGKEILYLRQDLDDWANARLEQSFTSTEDEYVRTGRRINRRAAA